MKVLIFEGTADEFQVVAPHLDIPGRSSTLTKEHDIKVEETEPKPSFEPKDAIRRMLKRIPISKGQREVFIALADGPLKYAELLKRTGKKAGEMAGILGALGRRINGTKEIHAAGLQGNVYAILDYVEDKANIGRYIIGLTPDAYDVMKEEGII